MAFCRDAVAASGGAKEHILSGKRELEDILSSGVERSYHVVTDVALAPLPSDRAKNLGNEKDGNGNGKDGANGGDNAPENQEKGKGGGTLTPEQLAALRGTPGKNKAAKVSEKSVDGQEQGSSIESPSAHKAENRDKVLAARNVAPEDMNDTSVGKQLPSRNIDFSRVIPKPKGHGY